jgi:hypothetical protein
MLGLNEWLSALQCQRHDRGKSIHALLNGVRQQMSSLGAIDHSVLVTLGAWLQPGVQLSFQSRSTRARVSDDFNTQHHVIEVSADIKNTTENSWSA